MEKYIFIGQQKNIFKILPFVFLITLSILMANATVNAGYFGSRIDNEINVINKEFIPKLNPYGPAKSWKHLRNELKDKNLKVCELALNELGLSTEGQTHQ